ncbi:MAG TPA: phosphopentomutase [Oscillospiraceae bacterium]|nr:phosphopentomutase [Oscillospiraceae bacterium]HRW56690.1 phosphopentomutase [Oscillospiraceae bacterium]
MSVRRVFWIVLDSFGIGALPDAAQFGDEGSNTLAACAATGELSVPNLISLGLGNIAGVDSIPKAEHPLGAFCRLTEQSRGKDTTIGHWELAGCVSKRPLPTYPNGFPPELIAALEAAIGRKVLCNRPYSGTQVIYDYGREHMATGKPIVYTSADSVCQIAAHESVIPVPELYSICETARRVFCGEHAVGRIIARPFTGEWPDFARTANRHDISLPPPEETALDLLKNAGFDVIGVGKINDIFAGRGLTEFLRTGPNEIGMRVTSEYQGRDFRGLCFVNLVDFDMVYGHRNDAPGYAGALSRFDLWLGGFLKKMRSEDVLMITADHGCDPSTPSTDHSREYIPLLVCGNHVRPDTDLGTRSTFADEAATIMELFGISQENLSGTSFWEEISI